MTTYHLKLQTLTPVHIGTVDEWRLGFDFLLYNNQTWVLNVDAVLQAKEGQLQPDLKGHYPLPGAFITDSDLKNPSFFRYVLRGQPPSEKADARMKPFIKDPFDRPYIPGSSLKGALRTALAWTGWSDMKMPPLQRDDIGKSKSWAGKPLEAKLFGKDANHDLLRTLQISDLFGPEKPGEGLIALKAQVLTQSAIQAPVGLETLASDIEFHGSMTIDETLFKPMAAKLGFSNRKPWLDELLPRAQKHSRSRISRLVKWFEQVAPPAPNVERIIGFYRQILSLNLASNQAIIQIGWGAGWDGKTFWTHLQQNSVLFEKLIMEFRMDKAGKFSKRKPGDPFPTSRRVAVSGKKDEAKPVAPLGWVLVEINQ